jgi:L-alanine-DL-glutamate epimerase-like enolase superfamily enzyme
MPKIERVEVRVTDYTSRLQRTTMHGDYDTGASGTLLGKPCLLRIFAEGIVGYAQTRPTTPGHSMPDTWKSVTGAFEEIIGPMLIGRDIFDLNAIFAEFDMILPFNPVVRTLLDFALHDAQGKATNQPVYNLLGGLSQELLPLEWSISMYDDPQRSINDALRGRQEFGINVACLKAGSPKGWRHDVMCFEKLREACGPDMQLGMDPNTAWSVPETILALEATRDARLDYIEQPIERRDHTGMAHIRRSARGTMVMADEALMSVQDAHDPGEGRSLRRVLFQALPYGRAQRGTQDCQHRRRRQYIGQYRWSGRDVATGSRRGRPFLCQSTGAPLHAGG